MHLLIKSKLDGRIEFNGLQISVETGRSRCRVRKNPHDGSQGMSLMRLPYGYITGVMPGVDGDALDCFVGQDREAENVYVIHTLKAPNFIDYDEDKCFIGCSTPEEAKRVFFASYSEPMFFGGMSVWPFEEFKQKILTTKTPEKLEKSGEEMCKKIGDELGVDWNKVSLDEFCDGMFDEQEHMNEVGGDEKKIAGIVLDHLRERPDYYSALKKIEKSISHIYLLRTKK